MSLLLAAAVVEGAWFGPRLIFTTTGRSRHTVTSLFGLAAGSAAHRTPGPLGAWLWRCPRISVRTDGVCVTAAEVRNREGDVCAHQHTDVSARECACHPQQSEASEEAWCQRGDRVRRARVVAQGRRRRRSRAERAKPPSFDFSRNFDLSRRTRRLLVSPEGC
jgi:hypothetical protein